MPPMRYEASVTRVFPAAHAIRLYDGSLEPIHGHHWSVELTVGREGLDAIDVVIDFHDVERYVDAIVGPWTNRHLNEVAPFTDGRGGLAVNPTAERVAWWIAQEVGKRLPEEVVVLSCRVGEAPGCFAVYRPGAS